MGDYNDAMMRNPNAAVQARTKAQNRANVLQLKLIGQSHPTGLTNNLLKLFEPRPPLEYKPPPEKRKCPPYSGMAQYVSHFAEPGDEEYAPPVQKAETPAQRRARIHKLRLEKGAQKAAEELEKYDPHKDPNATGDPYKTLFVARLSYETTEHRIKREFEAYGPIKRRMKKFRICAQRIRPLTVAVRATVREGANARFVCSLYAKFSYFIYMLKFGMEICLAMVLLGAAVNFLLSWTYLMVVVKE